MFILSKQSNSTPNLLQKGKKEARISAIQDQNFAYPPCYFYKSSITSQFHLLPPRQILFSVHQRKKENLTVALPFRNFYFSFLISLINSLLSNSCSLVYHFLVYQLRLQTGNCQHSNHEFQMVLHAHHSKIFSVSHCQSNEEKTDRHSYTATFLSRLFSCNSSTHVLLQSQKPSLNKAYPVYSFCLEY